MQRFKHTHRKGEIVIFEAYDVSGGEKKNYTVVGVLRHIRRYGGDSESYVIALDRLLRCSDEYGLALCHLSTPQQRAKMKRYVPTAREKLIWSV